MVCLLRIFYDNSDKSTVVDNSHNLLPRWPCAAVVADDQLNQLNGSGYFISNPLERAAWTSF